MRILESGGNIMEIKTFEKMGANIIAVSGKIDAYQAIKLKDALNEVIDNGSKKIIVNLAQVNFLDSTTLGTLISALKRVKTTGGEICVTCLQPSVKEIFQLTRLDKVFQIFTNDDEAMKNLGGGE
jgi:anti-sigma B factor antagonist